MGTFLAYLTQVGFLPPAPEGAPRQRELPPVATAAQLLTRSRK